MTAVDMFFIVAGLVWVPLVAIFFQLVQIKNAIKALVIDINN